ncbi:hypothetical protein HHK36_007221 [Tetracentron sinense]|uniref:Uncharacterized protein n=1 Tax=Tetracentron sinense TaxID=13715 RepID=A0A834ZII5_TETSI|nr:hypothetical protein HHK36_007221 [Tetracentron sinense]
MAETVPLKRHRYETDQMEDEERESKRHKSYNQILSLLEADEDDQTNQELSAHPLPEPASESGPDINPTSAAALDSSSSSSLLFFDEEEDKEGVIRHLLEASDDELGIPQREVRVLNDEEDDSNARGDCISLCGGFWEFEDQIANYYTLLQSELFM